MDLDQAMHLERDGDGLPGAVRDRRPARVRAARRRVDRARPCSRGQTDLLPRPADPLHPPVLSEDAASLLPGSAVRPAFVWDLRLDAEGDC